MKLFGKRWVIDGQRSLETLIRMVQALGLIEKLKELFVRKRRSIAQMKQAEAANQRRRAPRLKA